MDNLISVLNTCFILCLAVAILFFIISVVLFFIFDIRTVYNIRSGRAQAKTVKEMQEANTTTGRLRVGKTTQTSKLKASAPKAAPQPQQNVVTTEQLAPAAAVQAPVEPVAPMAETQLLSQDSAETEVLNMNAPAPVSNTPVEVDNSTDDAEIYFEVVKKIICRDTDEVIR